MVSLPPPVRALLFAAAASLSLMCASQPDPALAPVADTPPVPAFAQAGPFNGAFETRIDLALAAVRRDLGDWGPLDERIYRVEDDTAFDEIAAFYDAELAGWRRSSRVALGSDRAPYGVWEQGDRRFAALLVPGRPDDPWTFLVTLQPVP